MECLGISEQRTRYDYAHERRTKHILPISTVATAALFMAHHRNQNGIVVDCEA